MTNRRQTRTVRIGNVSIGGENPVLLQTMCASKTADVEATSATAQRLSEAGAGLVRIAVDSETDVRALREIAQRTTANLSIDLQENFRLAEKVAPFVAKIRYNPGHLHHSETGLSWQEKVRYLAKVADDNDIALRIGVNCGSLDPVQKAKFRETANRKKQAGADDSLKLLDPILSSALEHSDFLDSIGFYRYCVSLKDSDPETVIAVNRRFAELRPEIPLHLGVTEAGMPPYGILKSRYALETLLSEGIGETLRVSLTVENDQKEKEIEAGQEILNRVASGNILRAEDYALPQLNIVSCPSCSRVQNGRFVALAEEVRAALAFAKDWPMKIAVMGCRVNGPGETDNADFGLWCGPDRVNLKQGETLLGSWPYDEIVSVLKSRVTDFGQRLRG